MYKVVSLLVFHVYCDRQCVPYLAAGSSLPRHVCAAVSPLRQFHPFTTVLSPGTQMPVTAGKREGPQQRGHLPQQVAVTGMCQWHGQHQGPAVLLLPLGTG